MRLKNFVLFTFVFALVALTAAAFVKVDRGEGAIKLRNGKFYTCAKLEQAALYVDCYDREGKSFRISSNTIQEVQHGR